MQSGGYNDADVISVLGLFGYTTEDKSFGREDVDGSDVPSSTNNPIVSVADSESRVGAYSDELTAFLASMDLT